jgi:hypothetical protein
VLLLYLIRQRRWLRCDAPMPSTAGTDAAIGMQDVVSKVDLGLAAAGVKVAVSAGCSTATGNPLVMIQVTPAVLLDMNNLC